MRDEALISLACMEAGCSCVVYGIQGGIWYYDPHVSQIGFIKEISSKRNMDLRLW